MATLKTATLLIALMAACAAEPDLSSVIAADTGTGVARWLEGTWSCETAYMAVPGFSSRTGTSVATWRWTFADDLHFATAWDESGDGAISFTDSWTLIAPVNIFGALNGFRQATLSNGHMITGVGTVSSFTSHLDGAYLDPLRFGNPLYWNVDLASSFPQNGTIHGNFRVSVNRAPLANYANFECKRI